MLSNHITELVRARFSGIWVETQEPDEAVREIAELCHAEDWLLATWDVDRGLNIPETAVTDDEGMTDPVAAVRAVSTLGDDDTVSLLALHNFHRMLGSLEVVQALSRQIAAGKQTRSFVVVLAPSVQMPAELEKQFVVVQHELPGRKQPDTDARR